MSPLRDNPRLIPAGMAELVDARDSKSRDSDVMGVRFPLPAPMRASPIRRAVAAIVLGTVVVASGCKEGQDDLYANCNQDPKCRGQACVDVRGELYARGEYKSAGMLDCQRR